MIKIITFEKNKQGYLLVLEQYGDLQFDEEAYYKYEIYKDIENGAVSDERIDLLKQARYESQIRIVKKYAYFLLTKKTYTVKELRTKLFAKYNDIDVAEAVVTQLTELGYIDDKEYIKNYIKYDMDIKPESQKALKYKLIQKGIDKEMIVKELSDLKFSEYENARKIFEKKYLKYLNKDNTQEIKRKAYAYLARKGFNNETIRRVLEISLAEIE